MHRAEPALAPLNTAKGSSGIPGLPLPLLRRSCRDSTSLRDSFNIWLWAVAGTRQHGHAFAGHLPRHLAQFVGPLVVDGGQLLQGSGRTQLGDTLKCDFAGI